MSRRFKVLTWKKKGENKIEDKFGEHRKLNVGKIVQNFLCPFIYSKLTKIYRAQLRKNVFAKAKKDSKINSSGVDLRVANVARLKNSSRKTNKFRFFFRSDEGETVWRLLSDFNSERFSTEKRCLAFHSSAISTEKTVIKRWKQRSRTHGWVEVSKNETSLPCWRRFFSFRAEAMRNSCQDLLLNILVVKFSLLSWAFFFFLSLF